MLLGDGDLQLYDEHQQPLAYAEQGTPGFSWITRIFFAAYNAMKNRGGSIDSPFMSPTWLRAVDSFTDVGWHKVFIPIGPWRCGKHFLKSPFRCSLATQRTSENERYQRCSARVAYDSS